MSGVSSMMTSTPVAVSKARMFRPSRPMIRPFISSLGRATAATVLSAVCSAPSRWMAMEMIRARVPVGGAARLLLDVAHQGCGLAPGLVLDSLENLPPGILGGEPGDALQLDPLLLGQPVGLSLPAPETQLPLGQRLLTVRRSPLPGIDLLQLPLLGAGPFLGAALQPVPFLPPPQDLSIEILPQLERLHLGAEQQVGLGRFGVTLPLRARTARHRPARP